MVQYNIVPYVQTILPTTPYTPYTLMYLPYHTITITPSHRIRPMRKVRGAEEGGRRKGYGTGEYGSRTRQRRCSPSLKNTPMYWRRKSITSCPDGHAVAVPATRKTPVEEKRRLSESRAGQNSIRLTGEIKFRMHL